MPMIQKTYAKPNITGNRIKINFSIDDFRRMREGNYLYLDKTKMIEDLLQYDSESVILFTRPRRFGKSLNLSMIQYFFEMKEDSKDLFHDLYIEKSDFFSTHLNQYPVLYLNLKGTSHKNEQDLQDSLLLIIENEIKRLYKKYDFDELLQLSPKTTSGNISIHCLKEISRILYENTGKRVVVLIDEYDSLLNRTYGTEFWQYAVVYIKEILGELLQSNKYLEMGILTGVSKIGKELGFSDLNNLSVYGLTREFYYEYYGFTEDEIKELFEYYHIELTNAFYRMYNGYQFENSPCMFNTVSILKFLNDYLRSGNNALLPYWINDSTNSILKDNIVKKNITFKNKLMSLLDGSTIAEPILESIDYKMLNKSTYLISLLIDAGYLCPCKKIDGNLYEIKIPNEEVLYGYQDMIDSIVGIDHSVLESICSCFINADMVELEKKWNEVLLHVSSFHDFSEKENSYHNLMLGALLYLLGSYHIKSNRESGNGRFDIAMIPNQTSQRKLRPIIIEFKVAKESASQKEYSSNRLLTLAKQALKQIETKEYYAEYADIYHKSDFLLIGIGSQGKKCRISYV